MKTEDGSDSSISSIDPPLAMKIHTIGNGWLFVGDVRRAAWGTPARSLGTRVLKLLCYFGGIADALTAESGPFILIFLAISLSPFPPPRPRPPHSLPKPAFCFCFCFFVLLFFCLFLLSPVLFCPRSPPLLASFNPGAFFVISSAHMIKKFSHGGMHQVVPTLPPPFSNRPQCDPHPMSQSHDSRRGKKGK